MIAACTNGGRGVSHGIAAERVAHRAFVAVIVLIFAVTAALTIAASAAMGAMHMPGSSATSSVWIRMPGRSWLGAEASFVGMWIVMMAAMMMPSLTPMLLRYRHAVGRAGETRLGALTVFVGAGYFSVCIVIGMTVFPVGAAIVAAIARLPALSRVVPIAAGGVVLIAGVLQFTPWKAHHLSCCRKSPEADRLHAADAITAWRYGLRLGLHCSYSSAGLTTILLVVGLMDLRAMAVVTGAIAIERLAQNGERVARVIGAITVGGGIFLIARAIGL